jgi:transposase InsO family protein
MSRKGCSADNAACEGLFGRLKNEMFYNHDWSGTCIDQFIEQLNDYLVWYNTKRIKISLDCKSPIDYRKSIGIAV